ncbi:Hypothetical predicted protein [Paramuricea clavata]|uniref:DUF4440 domain-containing protein n=1 Tax=Paramuricea clavata TaxID=317549 RepID=A0A6S7GNV0_PARCT|nr:Hypothetical predicted protein [Paramuricea clavata]
MAEIMQIGRIFQGRYVWRGNVKVYFLFIEEGYEDSLLKIFQKKNQDLYNFIDGSQVEKVLEYYTEDCIILPPAGDTIYGKKDLAKYIEDFKHLCDMIKKEDSTEEEVLGEGDIVTSRASTKAYKEDGSLLFKSKVLTVWKKIDGDWLIYRLMWSYDKPYEFNKKQK